MINKFIKSFSKNSAEESKKASSASVKSSASATRTSKQKREPRAKQKSPEKNAIWDISQFKVPEEEGKIRFHDLGLPDEVMHAIADLGFEYCSPIQAQSLPETLLGHDAIGKAQTGTGKTAAFLITIIHDILNNPIEHERYIGEPRALIIAPTRELVMQIGKDALELCRYTGLKVVTLIGGVDYQKQSRNMQQGVVDIVVATPGRLLDFLSRNDVYLDLVELLVLDEADRMLDMGFIPQVRRIVRATPPKTHRQTLLYSATFSDDVMRLTEQWTYKPVTVDIEPEQVATDTVDQKVYLVPKQKKYNLLLNTLKQDDVESALIFANRRDQCRRLQERLDRDGIRCGLLSGEVAQHKRTRTLEDFRSRKISVLVATDVAGRGIHIEGISHVVNYTLPEDPEDYVHRIGRTGRAGMSGVSISMVCEDDAFLLPDIEELLGEKLSCETPPEEMFS